MISQYYRKIVTIFHFKGNLMNVKYIQMKESETERGGSMNSRKKRKQGAENFFFTLPAMICIFVMFYIPFAMGVYYSFTKWDGISQDPVWVGLKNYQTIFSSASNFMTSIGFTVGYTILFIIGSNIIALAFAVALTKKHRFANLYRGVFFIPYIMSMTIVGFVWKFIFSKGFATFYKIIPLGFLNYSWLGDSTLAFFSVSFVGIWQALGFYIVLYIAGLQAVPSEVLEAATVDGASRPQRFFRVTLPLLMPSITTCVFMSLTNGLKVFDIILALTKGGPGQATYSATMKIYMDTFTNNLYGQGSAEAIVYFAFVLVVTRLTLAMLSRREVDL